MCLGPIDYSGDSKESELLQLADLCTYVISARLRSKKGIDDYYKVIEPQIFGDLAPV